MCVKYFTCVSELIRIADTIELHYKDSMREMERSVCEVFYSCVRADQNCGYNRTAL